MSQPNEAMGADVLFAEAQEGATWWDTIDNPCARDGRGSSLRRSAGGEEAGPSGGDGGQAHKPAVEAEVAQLGPLDHCQENL